jgi:hypothetical protein
MFVLFVLMAMLVLSCAVIIFYSVGASHSSGAENIAAFVFACGFAALLFLLFLALTGVVNARDLDGRYANSNLKPWFDSLTSGKGPCCSNADGVTVSDPDWEVRDRHYRVRLDGIWIDVPDDAVITVPNLFGRTMVWPMYHDGTTVVRCFMPGAEG